MGHFAAFLGVAAVVIVMPGPDTALTVRNALLGGRRGGIATAAGVSTGQAVWAVLSAVGIAALLRASEPAFLAVRVAGACYLVYLGAHAIVEAVRGRGVQPAVPEPDARRGAAARSYRQGLLSNLGNPKMAIFFLSLLPQFTSGGSTTATTLVLGFTFCAMTFAWLSGYAVAVAHARSIVGRSRVRRALGAVTGAVMVSLGLRLLAEQR
jgi:threonine/homoserine/homoserine lactone efflux protein